MGSRERTNDSVGWATLLDSVKPAGLHPPGEGWKTMKELHSEMGFGICKTRRILQDMIVNEKVETFTGSTRLADGEELYKQVWYRPVDRK